MNLIEVPKSLQQQLLNKYEEVLGEEFSMEDNFIVISDEDDSVIGLFSYMLDGNRAYSVHVVSLNSKRFGMALLKFIKWMERTYQLVHIECSDPGTRRICEKKYRRQGDVFIYESLIH